MKKTFGRFFILLIIFFTVFCGITFDTLCLDNVVITGNDYSSYMPVPPLVLDVCNDNGNVCTLKYKLFNFFRVKKIKGTVIAENEVYLGGQPLGVSVGVKGVIIAGISDVITDTGIMSPSRQTDIKAGDILISIDGYEIFEPMDISKAISATKNKTVTLKLKRGDNIFEEKITMALDALSNDYKLGLMVKDNITGVGTLTYIKQNGRYGALGHHIIDLETGLSKELNVGEIYNCSIIGVVKGSKGKAGELKGVFNRYDKGIGSIDNNNNFGIFGYMFEIPKNAKKIKIGNEQNIQHGKAYIYTTIDGNGPDYYEIDIIKTVPQSKAEEKSMIISITDKRLIEATGGIVQGMSGSPIIQDNRLIGAVTHVFVNDPTKGYGVYINWMLDDNN